jgi:hypothetical protein
MGFQVIAGAAFRALTARKDGPSLYDLCDPVLSRYAGGDAHLGKFYKTALANPALRALLCRTGLTELKEAPRLGGLREALRRARDDVTPDWAAIGQPVADLLDTVELSHPKPGPAEPGGPAPGLAQIEAVIRSCGAHLLGSFRTNGFIPTYAAFNLIGDPDLHGRELLMALTGLNARGYKNSTLLFNLARVFIARSPARVLINPPWKGIAEPMWQPMQLGLLRRVLHRGAFGFCRDRAGLARRGRGVAAGDRRYGGFLPDHQPREGAGARRAHGERHHRAGAAAASAVFAVLLPDQAGPRFWHLCA